METFEPDTTKQCQHHGPEGGVCTRKRGHIGDHMCHADGRLLGFWKQEDKYRIALEEIAKGEGAYSPDPLTHANNTIENMKRIATEALK